MHLNIKRNFRTRRLCGRNGEQAQMGVGKDDVPFGRGDGRNPERSSMRNDRFLLVGKFGGVSFICFVVVVVVYFRCAER